MLRPWKLELEIDKKLDKALYLQIADTIITDIRSGRLKAGDTLPGSRNLAQALKINRNTVVEAYQVLINEEWVISRERKGIFVSENLPALHEKNADLMVTDEALDVVVPDLLGHVALGDHLGQRPAARAVDRAIDLFRHVFVRLALWHGGTTGARHGLLR